MTKAESKAAIPTLVQKWREARGFSATDAQPSFTDFYSWVKDNYPSYLRFKTTTASVRYQVEIWFDKETKQTWRN